MGQILSDPITAKESASLQNSFVKVGSSSMQGWRASMEDAHTHILALADDREASFFAVFDGHGGGKVATFVSRNLHKCILGRPEYKARQYKEAIVQGFLECDSTMRDEEYLKDEMSGTTCIVALLRGKELYVGNVGDSRCIASRDGKAEALSNDHKPGDPLEKARILAAGGYVEYNRVNGNLALSRALGDFAFKNNAHLDAQDQIVSAYPEVEYRRVEEDWQFILLACDGIWDVLTNQEVVDFVTCRLAKGKEPDIICEELMTRCLAIDCSMGGLGCDNMTVILVCFLEGQPYERLVARCAELIREKEELQHDLLSDIKTSPEDGENTRGEEAQGSLPANNDTGNKDADEGAVRSKSISNGDQTASESHLSETATCQRR